MCGASGVRPVGIVRDDDLSDQRIFLHHGVHGAFRAQFAGVEREAVDAEWWRGEIAVGMEPVG